MPKIKCEPEALEKAYRRNNKGKFYPKENKRDKEFLIF